MLTKDFSLSFEFYVERVNPMFKVDSLPNWEDLPEPYQSFQDDIFRASRKKMGHNEAFDLAQKFSVF